MSETLADGVRFRLDKRGSRTGVAVLTVGRGVGALRAESAFVSGRTGRATLLRLASCLAECAMEVGLGVAVMRVGRGTSGTDWP